MDKKSAFELYARFRLGAELLVKNKNGEVYFVDHGYSGKLVKTEERWEDAEPSLTEFAFEKSRIPYDIVSWEDEEPLKIYNYLLENNWLDNKEFKRRFGV